MTSSIAEKTGPSRNHFPLQILSLTSFLPKYRQYPSTFPAREKNFRVYKSGCVVLKGVTVCCHGNYSRRPKTLPAVPAQACIHPAASGWLWLPVGVECGWMFGMWKARAVQSPPVPEAAHLDSLAFRNAQKHPAARKPESQQRCWSLMGVLSSCGRGGHMA